MFKISTHTLHTNLPELKVLIFVPTDMTTVMRLRINLVQR